MVTVPVQPFLLAGEKKWLEKDNISMPGNGRLPYGYSSYFMDREFPTIAMK